MKASSALAAVLSVFVASGCGETPSPPVPAVAQSSEPDVFVAPVDAALVDVTASAPVDASAPAIVDASDAPDAAVDAAPVLRAPPPMPLTWRDDYLPEFRFDVAPADLGALLTAGHADRHPATLRYMGQTYRGTIRQRLGNNSRCGDKRQFRFDFGETVTLPDGYRTDRFETDRGRCYALHEWVAVRAMRQAAERHPELRLMWKYTNLVAVYFNDALYQVQTLTEDMTRAVPERFLGTRDVTMYEHGCSADAPDAWLNAFCVPTAAAGLTRSVDVPTFLYWAAVVKTLSPDDNFPDSPWNWYLVRNNATGVAYPVGDDWDSLPATWDVSTVDPYTPRSVDDEAQRHFVSLLADAANRARYADDLREARALLDPATLLPAVEAKYAQVRALIAATPDAPQSADWYDFVYTEELPAWVRARYAFLAQPAR